jgi:hypothetical protein
MSTEHITNSMEKETCESILTEQRYCLISLTSFFGGLEEKLNTIQSTFDFSTSYKALKN